MKTIKGKKYTAKQVLHGFAGKAAQAAFKRGLR
jgi:hypothetical protein